MAKSLGDTVELRLQCAEQDVQRAKERIAQAQRDLSLAMDEERAAEERVRYWRRIRALEKG